VPVIKQFLISDYAGRSGYTSYPEIPDNWALHRVCYPERE